MELCVKLVIYKDYTDMHGQQNIKFFRITYKIQILLYLCLFSLVHCFGFYKFIAFYIKFLYLKFILQYG
jgi:hypothetical protein